MLNRKKILYIITKSVWGGAQRYVYDLATNLPKDKFEATVVTGGEGPLIQKLEKQDIRVAKIPGVTKIVNIWQELKSLFYLYKIFVHEKPDVVHLSSSKFGGLGALAARLSSLVSRHSSLVIFTAHGWPFNEDRNFPARVLIYFFSWLTAIFSDRVINLTRNDYKQSLGFPLISKNKFVLIPNGVADEISFATPAEAKKYLAEKTGYSPQETSFLIGTIAELTKNKGLTYLIDAINQIKLRATSHKLQAIFIGEGEERLKLETQIKSLGLENTIFLAGFMPDAAKYLPGFDVFVLPSIKEGLPYVLLEAMTAGLPIVASDVGGIPDLIEHEKSGLLVKLKDSFDLAQELKKIIQGPEKYKILGSEAQKTIRTKFQFHAMLTKTTYLYDKT